MFMIKRALISVYDKSGLEALVSALKEYDVKIISSGGTARKIKEMRYPQLEDVETYTGYPESPGGLLKTLHPRIHGGFLLNRENPEHKEYLEKHRIIPFDMLVSNLYPFEKVIEAGVDLQEAIENIDIGGPTMTRSAAKSALLYGKVIVITNPSQYEAIIKSLKENNGKIPLNMIRELAFNAFKRTAEYDAAIVTYLKNLNLRL